jgi:hypothetical protein
MASKKFGETGAKRALNGPAGAAESLIKIENFYE